MTTNKHLFYYYMLTFFYKSISPPLCSCPNPDDTDRTKVIDVDSQTTQFPTHHKRFAFKMFTFVNRALPSNPGKKTQQYDAEVVDPLRDQVIDHAICIHAVFK